MLDTAGAYHRGSGTLRESRCTLLAGQRNQVTGYAVSLTYGLLELIRGPLSNQTLARDLSLEGGHIILEGAPGGFSVSDSAHFRNASSSLALVASSSGSGGRTPRMFKLKTAIM